MEIAGSGPVARSVGTSCRNSSSRIVHRFFFALLVGAIGFSCYADDADGWRLIDFSADTGLAVFSDAEASLTTFHAGDYVAGGNWRIEAIAADHVMLEPVHRDRARLAAGVLLRAGDEVPETTRVEPETTFYYEVHGVVVEEMEWEPGEDEADGEDFQ